MVDCSGWSRFARISRYAVATTAGTSGTSRTGVHGDSPDAVAIAVGVRGGVEEAGVVLRPFVTVPQAVGTPATPLDPGTTAR